MASAASGSDNGSAGGLRPWPGPGAAGLDADAGGGGGDAAASVAAALQSRRRAAGETYSRKEKSLGLLCENFVNLYGRTGSDGAAAAASADGQPSDICLDAAALRLHVPRRRIYDIVNVLEALGVVVRKAKNRYTWTGTAHLGTTLAALATAAARGDADDDGELIDGAGDGGGSSDDGEGGASQAPAAPGTAAAALAAVGTVYRLRKSVDTRKEKSLGVLSQRFVQLFLLGGTEMPPGDVGVTSSAAAGTPGSGPSGGGGVGDSSVGDTAGGVAPGASGGQSSTGLADGSSGGVGDGAGSGSFVSLEAAAARLLGPSVGATPAAVAAKMKTKVRRLYDIANILASLNIIKKVHTASRKPAFRWLGPATPQAPATAAAAAAPAAPTAPVASGSGREVSPTAGEAAAAASASAAAAAVIAGVRRSHAHLASAGPERSRKRLRVSPHVPVWGASPAAPGAAGASASARDSYVSGSADGDGRDDGSVGSATPQPAAHNPSVASTAPVSAPAGSTLTAGGSAAVGQSAVMAQYTAMLAMWANHARTTQMQQQQQQQQQQPQPQTPQGAGSDAQPATERQLWGNGGSAVAQGREQPPAQQAVQWQQAQAAPAVSAGWPLIGGGGANALAQQPAIALNGASNGVQPEQAGAGAAGSVIPGFNPAMMSALFAQWQQQQQQLVLQQQQQQQQQQSQQANAALPPTPTPPAAAAPATPAVGSLAESPATPAQTYPAAASEGVADDADNNVDECEDPANAADEADDDEADDGVGHDGDDQAGADVDPPGASSADVAALQAAVSTTVPDWLSPTSVERYMSAARAAGPEFERRAAEWHASVSTWKGAWQKWQGCVAITASGAAEAVPSVGSRR